MNKILIGIIICGVFIGAVLFLTKPSGNLVKSSVREGAVPVSAFPSSPSPSPSFSSPSFEFDSSTDLQSQLDQVNPKVEGSDFDAVKKTLSSF